MNCKIIFSVCLLLVATARSSVGGSIFDFLSWDEPDEQQSQRADHNTGRYCICKGVSCICCVDFNFLYFDLGGPGCVHMKYLSQEKGFAVNISYGESLVHADKITLNSTTTCIPILSTLAEMCAKFTDLKETTNDLTGCVQLEPKVLGDLETQINVGCFSANSQEMKFNSSTSSIIEDVVAQANNNAANNSSNESEDLNEDALLAAVSESAQQGLSFFNQLISYAFGNSNSTNITNQAESTAPPNIPIKSNSS